MTKRLTEDHIAVFWNTFLQFFLQVSAAMLVLAQTRNFTLKIFQASTGEAIDCNRSTSGYREQANCENLTLTLTIHIAAFVFRSMETIHFGVRSIDASSHSKTIA
jgi:hypothetical protein